jgi:hypothetical protein
MARDLTVSGSSYYLWLARPDLSGLLGWMPAALVAFMIPPLWRSRPDLRIPIAFALLVGVGATTLAGSASGPPGLRRATICLAVFYAMYVLCWQTATDGLRHSPGAWKPKVQVAALALLLVHHGVALLPNAGSLKADVPPVERHWFTVERTPSDSVEHWADAVVAGNALDCRAVGLGPARCRYAEVYGAVEGYVRWARERPMPQVRSYDFRSGAYVLLSPEQWPYGSLR